MHILEKKNVAKKVILDLYKRLPPLKKQENIESLIELMGNRRNSVLDKIKNPLG